MARLEKIIGEVERDAYGDDPKERMARVLGMISVNLADICGLLGCGQNEKAHELAEFTKQQANGLYKELEGLQ